MKHKQSKRNTASENTSLASTSSLNDDMNDKKNVKKQIVIDNIISPNVKTDGEFFDFITTRQILSDINVTLNVAIIRRIQSQQILVRFHRKRDYKMALKNAKNLQNFAEWRHLRLKPYEPPKETDESTESLPDTVLSDPNALPNPFINFASDNTVDSKSINILVIGASGVGKSTWINGMANYMNFNSFDDARFADDVTCLIPMKFNFPYGKDNLVNVKTTIGKSNNKQESLARGQSATQQPKVYRYVTDLYDFNLIDTPGICDTRGVEYDIENIKMIMECMSQWDVIHGVCILLKPNEARLKLSLRYCLQELLVNIHKECIPNIAAVFTNTCTTLYHPGETLTLLHKMTEKMKEEYGSAIVFNDMNTFCIENEAIKPLYAYHNGIELDECIIDDCSNSWEHTVTESYKMFKYFASLTPHSVSKTTATSQARGILRELCVVLDEVHLEISQNDRLHNEQTKQLKILENNLIEHKNGNCQGEFVEKTHISHPVTVCNGPNCVEPARSPNSNEFISFYKKLCCTSCHLTSGVPENQIGHPDLRACQIFNDKAMCILCGCSWHQHLHIRYTQKKIKKEFTEKSNQEEIQQIETQIAAKIKYIKQIEEKLDQLKIKFKDVQDLCRPYMQFLRHNSIIFANNAFEEYVQLELDEMENATAVGGDRTRIERLRHIKAVYEQLKIVTEATTSCDRTIDTVNMQNEFETLSTNTLVGTKLQNSKSFRRIFESCDYELVRCPTSIKVPNKPKTYHKLNSVKT